MGNPYKINGRTYRPQETYNFTQTGIASWYGPNFHGKPTANGEVFNQNALTAAHKTLQLPSLVRVTNLENGRSVIVRINDRGPFAHNRVIDMSKRGAELLQFKNQGTAKVKIQLLEEESRMIAQAAKDGHNISGVEIALNEGKSIQEALGYAPKENNAQQNQPVMLTQAQPNQPPPLYNQASYQTAPVQNVESPQSLSLAPQQTNLVKTVSVAPTRIFIQTGSFTSMENASAYAGQMAPFGAAQIKPTIVNGTTFYRVRLPAQSVEEADALILDLARHGKKNTLIIVE